MQAYKSSLEIPDNSRVLVHYCIFAKEGTILRKGFARFDGQYRVLDIKDNREAV